ncbi:MAG: polyprenol monophosphomannose synthase [Candidatus Aenigmarchaeota archaeon]|nr:polyprenol monophosphomannose synthase [Candidatus Aenigmarchaeota archaeon]
MHVSIILPTYNEKENIQIITTEIFRVFKKNKIKGEVIVVDDNSPDGTGAIAESLRKRYKNLLVFHRKKKAGLSSAVLTGIKISNSDIIGVMDADFSHPPPKIPSLLKKIKTCELVIGTRYAKGGKIKSWSMLRKIVSLAANLLAKPIVKTRDPTSGFFFFKKEIIQNKKLSPRGFKIGLEIMVKCEPKIVEVPYTFTSRRMGKSKFTFKEIFNFLLQLFSLYLFKIGF